MLHRYFVGDVTSLYSSAVQSFATCRLPQVRLFDFHMHFGIHR